MADLAKLVVRLEAEIGQYSENLEKAQKQLKKFHGSTHELLDDLQRRIAAFFAIDKLAEWGKAIVENADHVGKLSQSTGIAVEKVSELLYAFKQGGVDGDAFSTIIKKLNVSISEAAGNAKSLAGVAFKEMGINVRDASGHVKTADVVLGQLATKFPGYADGPNKVALATALMGREAALAIPILNGGAAGLARLGEEAHRAGAVISEDLAKKATELNDEMIRLKTTVVDGIGNQVAQIVLPALKDLSDSFGSTGDNAEAFKTIASELAAGLQLLASGGLIVGHIFEAAGEDIGAGAAAIVEAVKGNFGQAVDILKKRDDDQLRADAKLQERLTLIWREGGAAVLTEVKVTAKKIGEEAPNVAGGKLLVDAADAAIKKLREFAGEIAEQAGTFDKGESAAIKYRLEFGKLSDEVKAAGTAGKALVQTIERNAEAFEKMKRVKEVAIALAEVNAQIQALKGNSADAAIAEFDRKNFELVKKLRKDGNMEGQKQLDELAGLITAQADFNELARKAEAIQSDLARTEERIRNAREAGSITDIGMQRELGTARQKAVSDLTAIADEQQKIAAQTGNPEQVEGVKRLSGEMANLRAQSDLLGQALRSGFEETFSSSLDAFILKTKSASEAFSDFVSNIAAQLVHLATQQLAQQIFGSLGSNSSNSGVSILSSLFGGARASGGPVSAGKAYLVGENEPELFVPSSAGIIVPSSQAGGGGNISISIPIDARGATVDAIKLLPEVQRAAVAEAIDRIQKMHRQGRLGGRSS